MSGAGKSQGSPDLPRSTHTGMRSGRPSGVPGDTLRDAHRFAIALAVVATIAVVPLAVRASAARSSLQRESDRARATLADAGQLEAMRAQLAALPESAADSKGTPEASLATRVSGVLSAAGLSQSNLAGLSPESASQRSDAGTALRRRATLTLQSLTLRDLGRFIGEWRAREPAWAVTSIDLTPVANARVAADKAAADKPGPDKAATGMDLPVRAILVVETLTYENQTP